MSHYVWEFWIDSYLFSGIFIQNHTGFQEFWKLKFWWNSINILSFLERIELGYFSNFYSDSDLPWNTVQSLWNTLYICSRFIWIAQFKELIIIFKVLNIAHDILKYNVSQIRQWEKIKQIFLVFFLWFIISTYLFLKHIEFRTRKQ